jgi:hypothetical protein
VWLPNVDTRGEGQSKTAACVDLVEGLRKYVKRREGMKPDNADSRNRSYRDFSWFVMLHSDAELLAWMRAAEA